MHNSIYFETLLLFGLLQIGTVVVVILLYVDQPTSRYISNNERYGLIKGNAFSFHYHLKPYINNALTTLTLHFIYSWGFIALQYKGYAKTFNTTHLFVGSLLVTILLTLWCGLRYTVRPPHYRGLKWRDIDLSKPITWWQKGNTL